MYYLNKENTMKIYGLLLIKRVSVVIGSTLSFIVLSLFGFGTVIPSLMGQASAASPPCASGYQVITNEGGYSIQGEGVNEPVETTYSGNCFEFIHDNEPSGNYVELQNGDGHCLWIGGTDSDPLAEVASSACKPNHPNEDFTVADYEGGHEFINATWDEGLAADDCVFGSQVTVTNTPYECSLWNW